MASLQCRRGRDDHDNPRQENGSAGNHHDNFLNRPRQPVEPQKSSYPLPPMKRFLFDGREFLHTRRHLILSSRVAHTAFPSVSALAVVPSLALPHRSPFLPTVHPPVRTRPAELYRWNGRPPRGFFRLALTGRFLIFFSIPSAFGRIAPRARTGDCHGTRGAASIRAGGIKDANACGNGDNRAPGL